MSSSCRDHAPRITGLERSVRGLSCSKIQIRQKCVQNVAQYQHLRCREHVGRVSAGVEFDTQNRENVKKCDINVQILQKMRHLRHLCDTFATLFATPVLYCIPTLIGHFQLLRHQIFFFYSQRSKKKYTL